VQNTISRQTASTLLEKRCISACMCGPVQSHLVRNESSRKTHPPISGRQNFELKRKLCMHAGYKASGLVLTDRFRECMHDIFHVLSYTLGVHGFCLNTMFALAYDDHVNKCDHVSSIETLFMKKIAFDVFQHFYRRHTTKTHLNCFVGLGVNMGLLGTVSHLQET
jgi:hypothetical protein